MFILKREDVQIVKVKHPEQDQKILVLRYNNQTFRLIKVFPSEKHEEAMAFWRDVADNQHKFCVLLEEKERYSIWVRVKVNTDMAEVSSSKNIIPLVKCSLLLLQATYYDIDDLFGQKQGDRFIQEMTNFFQKGNFPELKSQKELLHLLKINPLQSLDLPLWEEHHLIVVLQELYRVGQQYFGNANFAESIAEIILDVPLEEQNLFRNWLEANYLNKLWK
jgi:hypothetical protein